jgi:hypothetical protein
MLIRIQRKTIVQTDLLMTLPDALLKQNVRVNSEVGPSCGHLLCRWCFRVCDFARSSFAAKRTAQRVVAVGAIVLIEQFEGTSLAPGTPYITAAFKFANHAENTAGGFQMDGGGDLPISGDGSEPRPVIDHVVQALALFWGQPNHGRTTKWMRATTAGGDALSARR